MCTGKLAKVDISLFIFSIMTLLIVSCKVSNSHYSYKLTTYSISNNIIEELPYINQLISYNEYLFEFKLDVRQIDTLYAKSGKLLSHRYYDTSGIYLLNPGNKQYVEFDTFSTNHKVVKAGKFSDKEFGVRLSDSTLQSAPFFLNKILKDTFLWGKTLYYIDTIQKSSSGTDSILTHIFFIKDINFTSMYELNSGVYPDPEYSMVGYSTYFFEQKIMAAGVLENMRHLTKDENKICKLMIKKARSSYKIAITIL